MNTAEKFIQELDKFGANVYTGVPCSFLSPLLNYIISRKDIDYYPLNNEGECIAFACGSYMSGKIPVVLFQNSGLGNAINPLTSLAYTFKIPFLIICTWRGQPDFTDEPQHELIGKTTKALFSLLEIENDIVEGDFEEKIAKAYSYIKSKSLPYALILSKGSLSPSFASEPVISKKPTEKCVIVRDDVFPSAIKLPSRHQIIKKIVDSNKAKHVIITTTGMTSRELYSYHDAPNYFYMIGSMGCALTIGLSMSIHHHQRKFIVIDGDGAILMRLENMASVGFYRPDNLIHIILDNNSYDSTGGQKTQSENVDFCQIASACGYQFAFSTGNISNFSSYFNKAINQNGPILIHVKITQGSIDNPLRPTIKPYEVTQRILKFLTQ